MSKPDLSIIIPTLNEEQNLPLLLDDLALQKGVVFEIIIADGGSTDKTCLKAQERFVTSDLSGHCLVGASGRGRQLNAGAAQASAEHLLFLHADSRLSEPELLREGLDALVAYQRQQGHEKSAGHFRLHFQREQDASGFGYYYYETKASLGRAGTINGDQGFLLKKSFWERVGPFPEDLPIMEDTSFAREVSACGEWLLLPGTITTSARRFETEGLQARQTLNALMMNFHAIGWHDFFRGAPDVYRQQDRAQPLQLAPFFALIRSLLKELPLKERWRIWMQTGAYVRSQAWQLGFVLDCRLSFRSARSAKLDKGRWLKWFDRWFDPMTDHAPGRALTALLVRIWFEWQRLRR